MGTKAKAKHSINRTKVFNVKLKGDYKIAQSFKYLVLCTRSRLLFYLFVRSLFLNPFKNERKGIKNISKFWTMENDNRKIY